MSGATFTLTGFGDETAGDVVLIHIETKVSASVSLDGRTITGTFRVLERKLLGDETWTGHFSVKRTHGG